MELFCDTQGLWRQRARGLTSFICLFSPAFSAQSVSQFSLPLTGRHMMSHTYSGLAKQTHKRVHTRLMHLSGGMCSAADKDMNTTTFNQECSVVFSFIHFSFPFPCPHLLCGTAHVRCILSSFYFFLFLITKHAAG